MKRLPFFLLIMCMGAVAQAQYWKAVGMGVSTIGLGVESQVQCLYGDTVLDRLLAGGIFYKILNEEDTVWAYGQAAWNGERWDSLATRISGGMPETYWFLRYHGHLYACGNFGFMTPEGYNRNFARLNEQTLQWEALECLNTLPSGLTTLVPKEPQDTLYATGYDGALCDQFPPTCVYGYDGTSFHRWAPFDQIPVLPNRYVSFIFKYKDKTYMAGAFSDPTGPGVTSFLRWNGTAWEHVPGWNNLLASILDYSIRNDTLYVAGNFTMDTGGPGNLVASFDGEQWNDMGGGLHCEDCPIENSVNDLQWFHGELWACGVFDRAMDMSALGIAKWNGHGWCVPPGVFSDPVLLDMAVWRDSLYVCGSIIAIDGAPVRQVAQWIGGDAVGECSTVGIHEVERNSTALSVTSLPDPGEWNVQLPKAGNWSVAAYDAMGQAVGNWHTNSNKLVIDLGSQAKGIYVLRASLPTGDVRSARLVQP